MTSSGAPVAITAVPNASVANADVHFRLPSPRPSYSVSCCSPHPILGFQEHQQEQWVYGDNDSPSWWIGEDCFDSILRSFVCENFLIHDFFIFLQDSVIHCFIPANRANHYRNDLKTGSIIRLDHFEVACVAHMYKITEHQFVIRYQWGWDGRSNHQVWQIHGETLLSPPSACEHQLELPGVFCYSSQL